MTETSCAVPKRALVRARDFPRAASRGPSRRDVGISGGGAPLLGVVGRLLAGASTVVPDGHPQTVRGHLAAAGGADARARAVRVRGGGGAVGRKVRRRGVASRP